MHHKLLHINVVLFISLLIPSTAIADNLFFDDFNDGFNGWTFSGSVTSRNEISLVPNSVRLRQGGILSRSFSTVGWQDVEVGFFIGARRLEGSDECIVEISSDGGNNWEVVKVLTDAEDDSRFRWDVLSSIHYDDNPDLRIRYRTLLNDPDDECYAEDVSITALPLGSASCPIESSPHIPFPGHVTNFDPINGSGDTNRSLLNESFLENGTTPSTPVNSIAFALPSDAAAPIHQFEGQLELIGESVFGLFLERLDTFDYTETSDNPRKHLPEFKFHFVQSGTHLIPKERGINLSAHPNWEFIIEPGRVWSELNDQGKTRAAFPFSIQQRNANCIHNGLMTFLFTDSEVSNVYYQVTSETCAYFQFDMWGLLEADYTPQTVINALQIASEHQQHLNGQMPQKPITALVTDYPGVNPAEFANVNEVAPENMTIYGVVVDGTHYVGGCNTRYGVHPYCNSLRVPSYSTSKTAVAALGAMRLEKIYGNFFDQIIADWVPEAASDPEGDFDDVTINNALDMATGNFILPGYFDDEEDNYSNGFFLPETYAEKMNFAVNGYPRQARPGIAMHYHSSDTFLVMRAQQNFYRDRGGQCADVFKDIVVDDVWKRLGFDQGSMSARRTYDPIQQTVGGLGATFTRDDVAKLGQFFNKDHGRIDNLQIIEPEQLAASKFGTAVDPGLRWSLNGRYNNAFWGLNRGSIAGCTGLFVPYMSGFGGITIAMAPSGVIYYYFSDGYNFNWDGPFAEAEKIRSSCIQGQPNPPSNLEVVSDTSEGVALRWTPGPTPINVMRFRVYRDNIPIALTSGNEWIDTDLMAGVNYNYYVEAVDVIGLTSSSGAELSFTPTKLPIAVPLLPYAAIFISGLLFCFIAIRSYI